MDKNVNFFQAENLDSFKIQFKEALIENLFTVNKTNSCMLEQ